MHELLVTQHSLALAVRPWHAGDRMQWTTSSTVPRRVHLRHLLLSSAVKFGSTARISSRICSIAVFHRSFVTVFVRSMFSIAQEKAGVVFPRWFFNSFFAVEPDFSKWYILILHSPILLVSRNANFFRRHLFLRHS